VRGPGRSIAAVLALAVVALVGILPPAPVVAGSLTDLLPDLRMAKPVDVHLCGVETAFDACPAPIAGTHHVLRFSATVVNTGAGPFQVGGHRDATCDPTNDPSCPATMSTVQDVLQSDHKTWRTVPENAVQQYDTGDGHHHWHVIGFERYELFRMSTPLPGGSVPSTKSGFCFFDGLDRQPQLPGNPGLPRYSFVGCGTPTSSSTHVGLSVGWGDIYPWNFEGQTIDLAGVPTGRYLLCLTADPANDFLEQKNWNNQSWAVLKITATSVSVIRSAKSRCAAQLPYVP
jgi:hypothetical protein